MARTKTDEQAVAVIAELLKHYTDQAALQESPELAAALYEKATELSHDAAVRFTQLGRAVQAASILSRHTPEGQLRFAARTIQKYNEKVEKGKGFALGLTKKIPELTPEQSKEIISMMEEIQALPAGDVKAMKWQDLQNYIADLVPTPMMNKIIAVWKAGLLTGLKTSGVNIFANFHHALGTEVIKDIPAVAVDSMAALFTKQRTMAFTTKGLEKGFVDGVEKGWRYLKTGYDERNIASKYDYKRVNFGKGKIAKGLQFYEEKIFGLMGAEDQPFYYGAKARSLYSQAKAQAINKGLKGKEAAKFVDDLVANPTDEMLLYAVADAETAVFQNATELGRAARGLQRLFGGLGEFVVPFGKTPSAVAMQIVNYSPVGIAKTIFQNVGKGKFDQKAFAEGIGRGLTGVAVLALGAYMYRKNMVSLDYPDTERERRLWEMEGKRENAVRIGGKWRSIQVLGPAGNLLVVGGQFQKALNEKGSTTEAIAEASARSVKAFSEQTFLTGMNEAMEAITNPERGAYQATAGLVASAIPTIINDIARGADPENRRAETIVQRMISRIPVLRETLEPQVDVLGETRYRKEHFIEMLLDPTRPTTIMKDPVIGEIRRLIDSEFPISLSRLGGKKGYDILTQKQNTEMWQEAGQIAYDKIDALMQFSVYDDTADDLKAKKINEIIRDAKTIARVNKLIEITVDLEGDELFYKLQEAKESGLLTREVYEKYQKMR